MGPRLRGDDKKNLLRRLAHGFPFAQRLGVARRDIRMVGIAHALSRRRLEIAFGVFLLLVAVRFVASLL